MASRGAVVGSIVAAGAAAGAAYVLTRKPAASQQAIPTGPQVTLTFSGGPSGDIPDPQGGHLTGLITTLANGGGADAHVTLSVGIVRADGSATPFRWYPYPDQEGLTYGPGAATVSLDLKAGAVASIRWGTTWSGNPGAYESIATLEVAGLPSKTFPDSQGFTIEVSSPAAAALQFSGGPSGTVTGAQGAMQRLGPLTTILTNTGGQQGAFAISVAIQGPAPARWYSTYGLAAGSGGQPQVTVTLNGGASASIDWYTDWTFEAANQGAYQSVATVNW